MCGLVGYFSSGNTIESTRLIKALEKIHHRGPDALGIWLSQDHKVALGHTRLSIIDLEGGNQPLHSNNNTIHAVVNGEFYQFESIREDLISKGYHFNSLSDSEILIALYQQYGTGCLKFLRGEFAFILWDEEKQRLFAARDRFGIKPLFYSQHHSNLYLASEAKALFPLGVPCQWNSHMLQSIETPMLSTEQSLFAGINSIKPGHFLLWQHDRLQSHCYWDFNYPQNQDDYIDASDDEIISHFRQELEQAVALRLRSDVPVGCYLSGGLDSCSVLGLIHANRNTPIDTFTISFTDNLYDEAEIAKEMSDKVNANHHCFVINDQMMRDNFADALYHNESLIFNNNTVAKFLLSQHTQNAGYKVIMTGEGSDEVLAGYPVFREDMLRYDIQGQDPAEVNQLIKDLHERNKASHGIFSTSGQPVDLTEINKLLGYIPSFFKVTAMARQTISPLHHESYQELIKNFDPVINFISSLNQQQLAGRSPLTKSLYLWSKSMLPNMILIQLGDRMEMAHSLEGRLPFLDHHLVEFLTRVPNHLKIRGLTEKYLLRESVKDLITDTVYKRQKHPFLAPPSSIKANPFTELMEDTFNSDLLKHNPFFNQSSVIRLFDKAKSFSPALRQEYDKIFMFILSVCTADYVFKPSMNHQTHTAEPA